ncbi:Linear gramicidin synthase subunit D [compost metagenome]
MNKSFFELGGHSLNATLLANSIYKDLHLKVALRELFLKPTISLMAGFIESCLWVTKDEDAGHGDDNKNEIII